jgi:polyhydroxyalkanoate synthesis regulator phasin
MPQTPDFSKYLDAGTDFVALTRTQARAQARELVSQGQLAQNQVQGFVDGLVEESRRRTDFFMDVVRQEIQRQVQSVGIATKDDLVKLEAKLAKQTKAAKKGSGTTKTSTKPSTPKKKKAASKAAGTKKAAGKSKKSSKSSARAAAS